MKCYLCELKGIEKCDICKKFLCEFHVIKEYSNRRSKKITRKICEKCLKNEKAK